MRKLTSQEAAKCPANCDHYIIVDSDVYFTNALGVGVYDVNGSEVDDSILDDGVFINSREIKKQFKISEHEFYDCEVTLEGSCNKLICLNVRNNYPEFNKQDVIAMAKHFGLTFKPD